MSKQRGRLSRNTATDSGSLDVTASQFRPSWTGAAGESTSRSRREWSPRHTSAERGDSKHVVQETSQRHAQPHRRTKGYPARQHCAPLRRQHGNGAVLSARSADPFFDIGTVARESSIDERDMHAHQPFGSASGDGGWLAALDHVLTERDEELSCLQ